MELTPISPAKEKLISRLLGTDYDAAQIVMNNGSQVQIMRSQCKITRDDEFLKMETPGLPHPAFDPREGRMATGEHNFPISAIFSIAFFTEERIVKGPKLSTVV